MGLSILQHSDSNASSPPTVDDCNPFFEPLLGALLPATTFRIEYKCHHKGTKAKRSLWIQYFANLVPVQHTVDLKAAAVIIDVRLFAAGSYERIGISVRDEAEVRRCVRDTADYHSLGSLGALYYRAGVNLNGSAHPSEDGAMPTATLEISKAVSRYESILETAISSMDSEFCSQGHSGVLLLGVSLYVCVSLYVYYCLVTHYLCLTVCVCRE